MSNYIKSKKFIGVVYNELKNQDKSYYIFYKLNGKTKRVHIGKKSEGINESFCHQKRYYWNIKKKLTIKKTINVLLLKEKF